MNPSESTQSPNIPGIPETLTLIQENQDPSSPHASSARQIRLKENDKNTPRRDIFDQITKIHIYFSVQIYT